MALNEAVVSTDVSPPSEPGSTLTKPLVEHDKYEYLSIARPTSIAGTVSSSGRYHSGPSSPSFTGTPAVQQLHPPGSNSMSAANSSVSSPIHLQRSWQRSSPVYEPTPPSSLSVAVSIIPAEQLAPSPAAGSAAGGQGVALGALARNNTYAAFGSSPLFSSPAPPMLANASFANSMSFANTKSFDDVLLLRHAATAAAANGAAAPAASGGGLGKSITMSGSVSGTFGKGSSDDNVQNALAATGGGAGTESVANSVDCYRVHLLLGGGGGGGGSASAASPTNASLAELPNSGGGEGKKLRQVSQVKAKWRQFLHLMQFIDSVAPKFSPPVPPDGYTFPIARGKSYVQNTGLFSGHEDGVAGDSAGVHGSPVMGTSLLSGAAADAHRHSGAGAVGNGSFGHSVTASEFAGKEELMVPPARREARRRFMEDYLNAALAAPSVNCLDELQRFVGYQRFVYNERTQFATAAAVAARQKRSPLPAGAAPTSAGTRPSSAGVSVAPAAEASATPSVVSEEPRDRRRKRAGKRVASSASGGDFEAVDSSPLFGISLHSLHSASGTSDVGSLVSPPAPDRKRQGRLRDSVTAGAAEEGGDRDRTARRERRREKQDSARDGKRHHRHRHRHHRHHHGRDGGGAASNDSGTTSSSSDSSSTTSSSGASRRSRSNSRGGDSHRSEGSRGRSGVGRAGSSISSGKPHSQAGGQRASGMGSQASSFGSSALSAAASVKGRESARPHRRSGTDDTTSSSHAQDGHKAPLTAQQRTSEDARSRSTAASSSSTSTSSSSTGSRKEDDARQRKSAANSSHASSSASHSTKSRHRHQRHHHDRQRRCHHRRDRQDRRREKSHEVDEAGKSVERAGPGIDRAGSGEATAKRRSPPQDSQAALANAADVDATSSAPTAAASVASTAALATTATPSPTATPTAAAAASPLPAAPPPPPVTPVITKDERVMLEECFRMLDTTGSGTAAVRHTLLFWVCAVPSSFAELMRVAQPRFGSDGEGEGLGTGGDGGTGATASAPLAPPPSRTIGEWGTASLYQSAVALLPAEVLALPAFETMEGHLDFPAFLHLIESVLQVLASSTAAAAPVVVSVAAWIDAFWVLQYCRVFTAIALLQHGESTAPLRTRLSQIKEDTYREQLARHRDINMATSAASASAAAAPPNPLAGLVGGGGGGTCAGDGAPRMAASPLSATTQTRAGSHFLDETTVLPVVLPAVAEALLSPENPSINGFDVFELFCFLFIVCESGVRLVSVEEVLSWVGLRSYTHDLSFSLEELASLLDCVSRAVPFSELLRSLGAANRELSSYTALSSPAPLQQQQQQQQPWRDALTQHSLDANSAQFPMAERAGYNDPHAPLTAPSVTLSKHPSDDSVLQLPGLDRAAPPPALIHSGALPPWRQRMVHHVRVLRLVSRCALVADPLVLAAVQDRVIEHGWRVRGGLCGYCNTTREALRLEEAEAAALASERQQLAQHLSEAETALVQQRNTVAQLQRELAATQQQLQTVMDFLKGDGDGVTDVAAALCATTLNKQNGKAVTLAGGHLLSTDAVLATTTAATDEGGGRENANDPSGVSAIVKPLTPHQDGVTIGAQIRCTGAITFSVCKDVPLAGAEYPAVFYVDLYPCRQPLQGAQDPPQGRGYLSSFSAGAPAAHDRATSGAGSLLRRHRRERISLRDEHGRCLLSVLLDANRGTLTITGASSATAQRIGARTVTASVWSDADSGDGSNNASSRYRRANSPDRAGTGAAAVARSTGRGHGSPLTSSCSSHPHHHQHLLLRNGSVAPDLVSRWTSAAAVASMHTPRPAPAYALRQRNLLFPSYTTSRDAKAALERQAAPPPPPPPAPRHEGDGGRGEASDLPSSATPSRLPHGRCSRTVAVHPGQWHRLRVGMDWTEGSFHATVAPLLGTGSTPAPAHARRSPSQRRRNGVSSPPQEALLPPARVLVEPAVLDFTAFMLDGAKEVEGLATIDIYPRRSLLYAYCNTCLMFDPVSFS